MIIDTKHSRRGVPEMNEEAFIHSHQADCVMFLVLVISSRQNSLSFFSADASCSRLFPHNFAEIQRKNKKDSKKKPKKLHNFWRFEDTFPDDE